MAPHPTHVTPLQAQLDHASDAYKAMADYWAGKLASPPGMLQLPLDKPRPAFTQGSPAVNHAFVLEPESVASLKQLATSLGCSLYAVFVALFRCALSGNGPAGAHTTAGAPHHSQLPAQ